MAVVDKIKFVDDDPDAIVSSLISNYESLTGRVLQPAQVETVLFNSIAYRLSLALTAVNETANKCLVHFADGIALEALGELVGVTRLLAAPALCTLRFNLVAGHGALLMDSGLRVQSTDGQAVFITTEEKNIATDDTYVDIQAECTLDGIIGNGYVAGIISVILDPRPYVSDAANLDTTNAGNDDETDDDLRARIILAPSRFSVAGPKGAYIFFAKSAAPSIVDVAVTIGHDPITDAIIPGQVDIFPLLFGNATPGTEITDAIYAACNDDKVRPLTDTVVVKSPVQVDYTMSVELTLLPDAISSDKIAEVTAKLEAYRDIRKNKLGIDVVMSQILGLAMVDKVYSAAVTSPSADIVVGESSFTNCTGITVTVVGTHDE